MALTFKEVKTLVKAEELRIKRNAEIERFNLALIKLITRANKKGLYMREKLCSHMKPEAERHYFREF